MSSEIFDLTRTSRAANVFWRVLATALCLSASINAAQAGASLCQPNERIVYSCDIKNSKKTASLCASQKLTADEGYVQYRFGTPGRIEMTFPEQKRDSLQQFTLSHYSRPMVDRLTISFENGGYGYTYISDYEGDVKPPVDEATINVSHQGGKKSKTLVCAGKRVADFSIVEGIMPCDEESSGECP